MEDILHRLIIEYQLAFDEGYPEYEYVVNVEILSECL